MRCGVGCRHRSDPALGWLWRRQAAVALIAPSLGTSICCGCCPKKQKKKKKKRQREDITMMIRDSEEMKRIMREFPSWLSSNDPKIHEDVGSPPGLAQ